MGVLHRELGALYAAFARGEPDPLPPLPVQYADYAAWHRRWVEGPVLEAQAEYWTRTLAGAPELLELPTDRPRPAKQDFAGASVKVELDEALAAALRTLSQRHGTTLFMTLLAGWAAVLARLSGQDDVVIGTPSANRGRSGDGGADRLLRQHARRCAWTSPARPRWPGCWTGSGRSRWRPSGTRTSPSSRWWSASSPTRSLAHTPALPGDVRLAERAGGSLELPGLAVGPLDPAGSDSPAQVSAKFDLSLTLWEDGGRIAGRGGVRHRALRPGDGRAVRGLPAAGAGGDGRGRPPAGRPPGAAGRGGARPAARAGRRRRARVPPRHGGCALRAGRRRRAGGRGAGVGRRADDVRGAGRSRQPPCPPPAPRRRGRGDARGRVPGARTGDGRRHAGGAQGGRRVRAAGPGVSRRSGWPSCWPTPPSPCW